MDGPRHRVVVTQKYFDDAAIAYLVDHGCEVQVVDLPGGADKDATHNELAEWLSGANGWIVGHARVTRDLLLELPDLLVVSRRGVGYDRVDLAAVKDLGRVATIAAGSSAETVADQAIGLMLAVGRRFGVGQGVVAEGKWDIPVGTDLFEKTVGVVGYGRIGSRVVRRLRSFEAEILVTGTREDLAVAEAEGFEYVPLADLLRRSDYLTLHTPLNAETRFLIRDETIAQMKPSGIVINTARGGLVEDRHLFEALQEGRLGGAGLDVFVGESDPTYAAVTADLASLPNVVAQPHSGASTNEALQRTNFLAARNVVAVLSGCDPAAECIVADGRGIKA